MDLIRCNATEPSHCKWLTLTYANAMTDHTKVYEDGKMFLRRLQRYLNKSKELVDSQKSFKRITVAEPQGKNHDNSWHLHILLIFDVTAPFIANGVIADLWGHGITDTRKVYDTEGLALYFKAYLSDVEYEDETGEEDTPKSGIVEKKVDGKNKKFIKGERLKLAIDPVVIRHDIAKMLRLEEERGDGQQYGKWNNRLVYKRSQR